ncbi:hypothetical protein RC55_07225 [Herbaspirillum seropedicae]|nr:hypothetical protein ACP92_11875 [Herbaspirillum seropedicae]NQE29019.1 hypothetical protein [Herbaspirillum seropedicae]
MSCALLLDLRDDISVHFLQKAPLMAAMAIMVLAQSTPSVSLLFVLPEITQIGAARWRRTS